MQTIFQKERFLTLSLRKIKISKGIAGRMLLMLSIELAPVLHTIFVQSFETGQLPNDWSLANVTSIFKKEVSTWLKITDQLHYIYITDQFC